MQWFGLHWLWQALNGYCTNYNTSSLPAYSLNSLLITNPIQTSFLYNNFKLTISPHKVHSPNLILMYVNFQEQRLLNVSDSTHNQIKYAMK